MAKAATFHGAWQASGFAFSLRSACRWLARWRGLATHVRTRLHMVAAPPGKAGGPPDPDSLRHLAAAFRDAACPVAAFQLHFQLPVTG